MQEEQIDRPERMSLEGAGGGLSGRVDSSKHAAEITEVWYWVATNARREIPMLSA